MPSRNGAGWLIGKREFSRPLRDYVDALKEPRSVYGWVAFVAVLGALLTASRRPDSLLHAQFWAEDGHNWYAEAYNGGWLQAALTPHTGYFQTLSRLTAALSLLVDFRYAPVMFNLIALFIQVLPAVFLVTPRCQKMIPDFRVRLLMALLYIGIPNSYELDANITNAMTHLALLAVLIILAEPSRRWAWRVFDVFWLVLSGLSGPFVVALLPVALFRWLTERKPRWRLVLLAIVSACTAIQAAAYVATGYGSRPHPPLGVAVHTFVALVAGQVFVGLIGGLNRYTLLVRHPVWNPHSLVVLGVFVTGMVVFGYAFLRGGWSLRLFIGFAWLLLVASLANPVVSATGQQWVLMALPGVGDRYYLMPMLGFLVSLVWIAGRSSFTVARIGAGLAIAATISIGIPGDWRYPAYSDFQPDRYAQVLDSARPGTRVDIPINPPGWTVNLIRK